MNHKKCRKIFWLLLLIGFIITGIPLFVPALTSIYVLFAVVGAIISISGIIFALKFLRCPHCGVLLNMIGLSPGYCPSCGEGL